MRGAKRRAEVAGVLDIDIHGRDFTLLHYSNSSLRSSAHCSSLRSSQVMNSVTHGLGIILCVVGTILMSRKAVHSQR